MAGLSGRLAIGPFRKIIHVDMDCFYAAVEVKHRPELKGKPLGVGGPANSRSVLTTASYEARRFGVRSAMPCSQALRLCPDLILVPPHFELYKKESRAVREIFSRYTDKIEPLSLDEAYLDVTESTHCQGSATLMAREIRRAIQTELQLTASAGIAPNKFLAKIASDWKKPNGQFVIRPEDIESFMPPLPVEKIHGVGRVTAAKMHALGLFTCADIQRQPLVQLVRWFGSRALELSELARGQDSRPVRTGRERKSLTVETTFARDLESIADIKNALLELYEDWQLRMTKIDQRDLIRGHVVKVKFFDFKTTTLEMASRSWPTTEDFQQLIERAWRRREVPVRLVGLGVRLTTPTETEASPQLKLSI